MDGPCVGWSERQFKAGSGHAPPSGFGAPEPQESGASQRSFVGAGKRPLLPARVPLPATAEGRWRGIGQAEQAAKNLPGYMDMLDAVVKKAPAGLSAPLAEFNQYSRHALNSFVHSGIHALHRARDGYPAAMAATVVRFSNGLMHFAYRLLASLSGSQRRMDRVTRLYENFQDCVPMAPVAGGSGPIPLRTGGPW